MASFYESQDKPPPFSRPAATAHSPNRKPRGRQLANIVTQRDTLAVKGKRIVQAVAVGETREEAAAEAGTTLRGLKTLERRDPEFKAALAKAEEGFAEACKVAKGELASRIVRITQRVGDTVLDTKDEKLILSGGLPIMRGCGVLVEKSQTETDGTLEIVIRVKYDDPITGNNSSPPKPALPAG